MLCGLTFRKIHYFDRLDYTFYQSNPHSKKDDYMKYYLTFFLLYAQILISQDIQMEVLEIEMEHQSGGDCTYLIPFFYSDTKPKVADRMNYVFHGEDYVNGLTPDNWIEFNQDDIPCLNGEDRWGTWYLALSDYIQNKRFLGLNYEGAYMGAYPSESDNDYYFDLKTGNLFPPESLFSLEGYFDFFFDFWVEDCINYLIENQIEYKRQDSYQTFSQCFHHIFDFSRFEIGKDSVLFYNYSECIFRNEGIFVKKKFHKETLKPYLNDFGKYMLFDDYEYVSMPINYFLVEDNQQDEGKMFLAIQLVDVENTFFEGYYFYENEFVKIPVKGKVENGFLELQENGIYKGNIFLLEWDDFKYSTKGTIYNPKEEANAIEFYCVYNPGYYLPEVEK